MATIQYKKIGKNVEKKDNNMKTKNTTLSQQFQKKNCRKWQNQYP